MKVPSRRRPASARKTPAIMVASTTPSMPWRSTADATRTMKAPAGPPTWKRLPPSAEMRKPPTMAVNSPRSGVAPEAMAIAIESGSATMATVSPAMASARSAASP